MTSTESLQMYEFDTAANLQKAAETHRRGEARINVVGPEGPVPDAKVQVNLTRHAFAFGSNAFGWAKMGNLDPQNPKVPIHKTLGDDHHVIESQLTDRVIAHGADYDDGTHPHDRLYTHYFTDLYNLAVVPFYELAVSPKAWQSRLHRAGMLIDWAHRHGMQAKGHPLIFHQKQWDMDWWNQLDREQYWQAMKWRQSKIMGRFCDSVDYWDFINEPISHTPPYESVLDAAIRSYELTRSLNPHPNLTLNFNQVEAMNPEYRPQALELVEQLLERGMRPDIIGIQSHLGILREDDIEKVTTTIDAFARYGIPLHFTETTFRTFGRLPEEEREPRQAHDAEAFYRYIFSRPEIHALIWWDLCDRHCFCEVGGLLRTDMTPKPAFHALRHLIREQWHTRTTLTIEQGTGQFTGYYGTYEAQIELPDGSSVFDTFELTRQPNNPITLTIN